MLLLHTCVMSGRGGGGGGLGARYQVEGGNKSGEQRLHAVLMLHIPVSHKASWNAINMSTHMLTQWELVVYSILCEGSKHNIALPPYAHLTPLLTPLLTSLLTSLLTPTCTLL